MEAYVCVSPFKSLNGAKTTQLVKITAMNMNMTCTCLATDRRMRVNITDMKDSFPLQTQ